GHLRAAGGQPACGGLPGRGHGRDPDPGQAGRRLAGLDRAGRALAEVRTESPATDLRRPCSPLPPCLRHRDPSRYALLVTPAQPRREDPGRYAFAAVLVGSSHLDRPDTESLVDPAGPVTA